MRRNERDFPQIGPLLRISEKPSHNYRIFYGEFKRKQDLLVGISSTPKLKLRFKLYPAIFTSFNYGSAKFQIRSAMVLVELAELDLF